MILIDHFCHARQKQLVDVDIPREIAQALQDMGDGAYFGLRNASGRFEEFAFAKKVVTLCNLVWLQVTTGNKDIDRFVTVAVVSEPVHLLKAARNRDKADMWPVAQLRFTTVPFCGRSVM